MTIKMKTTSLFFIALLSATIRLSAQVTFVQRGWDETNKTVTETQRTLNSSEYTELKGNNPSETVTLASGGWYVVRDANVARFRLIAPEGKPAHLILCDDAQLSATVTIGMGQSLNIYGQSRNSGWLVAESKETHSSYGDNKVVYSPIGGCFGDPSSDMGTLTIHGGEIYANGRKNKSALAPAIGGSPHGNGGTVNIYGGKVTAIGGYAGIGGGSQHSGGTTNIYGGTVYAEGSSYGAGIGHGGGYNGCNGGTTNIYGGEVHARGGEWAAGIGGGKNGSGGTITISGGTVWAYGGEDAAGIGSGEEATIGNSIDGGTITITGGTVEAWGNDEGAGIGAGEDAALGHLTITGGTVIAHGGTNSKGICTNDTEAGTNRLDIGNNMRLCVSEYIYPAVYRYLIQGFHDIQIEPCAHEGATYTVNGNTADGTHTMHCNYCLTSPTEKHTFNDNATCSVCGFRTELCTISIYVAENGSYSNTPKETYQVVKGTSLTLPAPPAENLPAGVTFAGWLEGTPTGLQLTSPTATEGETYISEIQSVSGDMALTARYHVVEISLSDAADNSLTLLQNEGKDAESVTLVGRTLYKDGAWNTICLPFDLSAEQLANDNCPLKDATIMQLSEASFSGSTLTLNFANTNKMEHGRPYIVKWERSDNVDNPTFKNVTIKNEVQESEFIFRNDNEILGRLRFVGSYDPVVINGVDNTKLFLGANNKLYYPNEAMTIGACRAYFLLDQGLTAGNPSSSSGVRGFVLNFGEYDPTAIASQQIENSESSKWVYDLFGRKVTKPQKGNLYIKNGKKVIY